MSHTGTLALGPTLARALAPAPALAHTLHQPSISHGIGPPAPRPLNTNGRTNVASKYRRRCQ